MLDKYLAMKRFYRCSALFLCWMAKRISGWGICVSPFVVFCLFVVVCAVDLPFYMTTGVNVDVILNCFFTCKDRASERDRPYQRKKKKKRFYRILSPTMSATCLSWATICIAPCDCCFGWIRFCYWTGRGEGSDDCNVFESFAKLCGASASLSTL